MTFFLFPILILSSPAAAKSENDFYRELTKKSVAANEDAVRAAARFKGYRGAASTALELRYLKDIGVPVPRKVARHPRRPLTKGDAANLFLNAMQDAADRRGLLGRFFTGSRRFAARDAMAQKLLPGNSLSNEFMSGGELLSMLGRAVEQMGKKND